MYVKYFIHDVHETSYHVTLVYEFINPGINYKVYIIRHSVSIYHVSGFIENANVTMGDMTNCI